MLWKSVDSNVKIELVALMVRASLKGLCQAIRPGFESRFDRELFISTFHLVQYTFAFLLCQWLSAKANWLHFRVRHWLKSLGLRISKYVGHYSLCLKNI